MSNIVPFACLSRARARQNNCRWPTLQFFPPALTHIINFRLSERTKDSNFTYLIMTTPAYGATTKVQTLSVCGWGFCLVGFGFGAVVEVCLNSGWLLFGVLLTMLLPVLFYVYALIYAYLISMFIYVYDVLVHREWNETGAAPATAPRPKTRSKGPDCPVQSPAKEPNHVINNCFCLLLSQQQTFAAPSINVPVYCSNVGDAPGKVLGFEAQSSHATVGFAGLFNDQMMTLTKRISKRDLRVRLW